MVWKDPSISINLDGDKELMAEFNRMSKGVGKKSLTYATLQGANVIKREASLRAPRGRTGNLKRGIVAKVLKTRNQLVRVAVSWTVSRGDKSPFYGLFIEKGTKEREQKTKKEWTRKWRTKSGVQTNVRRNRKTIASYVPKSTGRVVSRPFLEPAYDAKRRQAGNVIKKELWRIIKKVAKRGMLRG